MQRAPWLRGGSTRKTAPGRWMLLCIRCGLETKEPLHSQQLSNLKSSEGLAWPMRVTQAGLDRMLLFTFRCLEAPGCLHLNYYADTLSFWVSSWTIPFPRAMLGRMLSATLCQPEAREYRQYSFLMIQMLPGWEKNRGCMLKAHSPLHAQHTVVTYCL
jgi:hypothetical protein